MARFHGMHRATLAHTISNNLRLARQGTGLSQEAFGKLIGRSRTWVVKAESGRNLATPERIELWAEATGRDPLWFYTPHTDAEDDVELEAIA